MPGGPPCNELDPQRCRVGEGCRSSSGPRGRGSSLRDRRPHLRAGRAARRRIHCVDVVGSYHRGRTGFRGISGWAYCGQTPPTGQSFGSAVHDTPHSPIEMELAVSAALQEVVFVGVSVRAARRVTAPRPMRSVECPPPIEVANDQPRLGRHRRCEKRRPAQGRRFEKRWNRPELLQHIHPARAGHVRTSPLKRGHEDGGAYRHTGSRSGWLPEKACNALPDQCEAA